MNAHIRFALAVVVLGLLMTGPFVLTAILLLIEAQQTERQAIIELLTPHLPLGAFITAFGFVLGVLVIRALFRQYVKGLSSMSEKLRLMRSANRHFRVEAEGPPEVRALAQAANDLAQQRDELLTDVEARIARAKQSVEEEKNRLAALMSELALGVIVCNLDGRILLYNNRARLQFKASTPMEGALLGLGRSIFTVFEREQIAHALENIRQRLHQGSADPVAYFMARIRNGQPLRVHMAAVRGAQPDAEAEITGYVLTIENTLGVESIAATPEAAAAHGQTGSSGSRPEYYDFNLFGFQDTGIDLDRELTGLAYTVFDTETTGLEPASGDEIIQIGAVRMVNGRLLYQETFDQLVNPLIPLKPEGIPIHGITGDMLHGQPTIEAVLPAFHSFCADTVLVAHNAAFDMRFLQMKEAATGICFQQPVLDTLLLSAVLHPNQESHRLESIAERLGINVIGRHTALGDAIVTGEIFLKMIGLLNDMGIHTLRQALAATQKTWLARVKY